MSDIRLGKDSKLDELLNQAREITGELHHNSKAIRAMLEQYPMLISDLKTKQDLIINKNQQIEALEQEREETAKMKAHFTSLIKWANN